MTKTEKAVVTLAIDVIVLHASLCLTEPRVNEKQLRLSMLMAKLAMNLLAPTAHSKPRHSSGRERGK